MRCRGPKVSFRPGSGAVDPIAAGWLVPARRMPSTLPQMRRLNSEGIRREDLANALRDRRQVHEARRIDSCLLCRRPDVNEAGLCEVCYVLLSSEEADLAEAWLRGTAP